MKRRVKRNVWGNWRGYEGTRYVIEFGTDEVRAGFWLLTGRDDRNAGWATEELRKQCEEAAQRGS